MCANSERLGNVLHFGRGISWSVSQESKIPGTKTYPVLRIPNIQEKLNINDLLHIRINSSSVDERKIASKDSIILVGSNGNPARVGNAAFIDNDSNYLFASFLIAGKLKSVDLADPKYLFHVLSSPSVQDAITKSVQGTTGLKNLSISFLESLEYEDFETKEQCAIATILDTMDEAIRRTETVIAKLRQLKAGMLNDLLTRGLDENGEIRDPIRHPEQFKEAQVGLIPKQWEVKNILEVAPIVEGQVDPRISPFIDFPLVAPDHIESGTGRLLSLRTAGEQGAISGKYHFKSGDVVYSKIRPYLRKAYLASFEGICSADMYPFRPTLEMNSQFLLMTLLSERFSRFASSVSERSGFPKINRKEVGLFYVALPEIKEQNRISQVTESIEQKLMTEQICKEKLIQLKQGLMHDLLTGIIRVPQHLQPDKATVADTEQV